MFIFKNFHIIFTKNKIFKEDLLNLNPFQKFISFLYIEFLLKNNLLIRIR